VVVLEIVFLQILAGYMLDNDVSVAKFLSFGTLIEPALTLFKNVPTRPGVHGFMLRNFFKKVKD